MFICSDVPLNVLVLSVIAFLIKLLNVCSGAYLELINFWISELTSSATLPANAAYSSTDFFKLLLYDLPKALAASKALSDLVIVEYKSSGIEAE